MRSGVFFYEKHLCLISFLFFLEKGICLSTVTLWILLVYTETSLRLRDLKNPYANLSHLFAAHWYVGNFSKPSSFHLNYVRFPFIASPIRLFAVYSLDNTGEFCGTEINTVTNSPTGWCEEVRSDLWGWGWFLLSPDCGLAQLISDRRDRWLHRVPRPPDLQSESPFAPVFFTPIRDTSSASTEKARVTQMNKVHRLLFVIVGLSLEVRLK